MKVLTTPSIVVIQGSLRFLPLSQIFSLIVICIGVGMATIVSPVEDVNFLGTLYGVSGVLVTSLYQIWVKTEQERIGCTSEELLSFQAPVSAVLLLPFAEPIQGFHNVHMISMVWVTISAALAVIVNLSIFLVIKSTSPLSYNVLGHGKLVFILLSGYFWFGEEMPLIRIAGIFFTLAGIFSYTYLKMTGGAISTN